MLRPAPKPGGEDRNRRVRAKANGKKAETRVATRLGGRKVMYSGAGVLEKGDVRVDAQKPPLFVEVKYSGELTAKEGKHSVSFQQEWVEKTVLDAKAAGCVPVIALAFANDSNILYCTTSDYFEELVRQSQELHRLLST